jgi:hypothetical protein
MNSTGPEVAHTAQPLEKTGARPRLRGRFARRSSGFWANGSWVRLLFEPVTDRLQGSPCSSNSSQREVPDGGERGCAPVSHCTGQTGRRQDPSSNRHEIGATMIVSPNLIASKTN